MGTSVRPRPRPWPRHAGATQIVPIQPTGPLIVATPVPTISPSAASATKSRQCGLATANSNQAAAVAPVVGQDRGAGGLDVGAMSWRIGRRGVAGMSAGAIIGRMATLSRADVEHVAHLARLGLTDEELGRLEGQLNHILDQYAILATVPTDHIAPTAQTIELENILREDVARPSLPVEDVLANAPARDGDFIVVPAILGERD